VAIRERIHQPFYDSLTRGVGVTTISNMQNLPASDATYVVKAIRSTLYFPKSPPRPMTIMQFKLGKWAICDVCGGDTPVRVVTSISGHPLAEPINRHIACHNQLQAHLHRDHDGNVQRSPTGIRQERGTVLPVIGQTRLFHVPNRIDRKRLKYEGEPDRKARHIAKWRNRVMRWPNQPFKPLQYLNQFDGVKVVQYHLDGIMTRDVQ